MSACPAEEEERGHGADMEGQHEKGGDPVAAEVLAGAAQHRHVLPAAIVGSGSGFG